MQWSELRRPIMPIIDYATFDEWMNAKIGQWFSVRPAIYFIYRTAYNMMNNELERTVMCSLLSFTTKNVELSMSVRQIVFNKNERKKHSS